MTMSISAETVKTLRERTGAGMMECKKALVETGGDLDAAAEIMRKAGLAKADKKAGRIAAEGTIATAMARRRPLGRPGRGQLRDGFRRAPAGIPGVRRGRREAALAAGATTPEALAALALGSGATVEETRRSLIAKIGEKIDIRRAGRLEAPERDRRLRARHAHRRAGRRQGRR